MRSMMRHGIAPSRRILSNPDEWLGGQRIWIMLYRRRYFLSQCHESFGHSTRRQSGLSSRGRVKACLMAYITTVNKVAVVVWVAHPWSRSNAAIFKHVVRMG